MGSGKGGRGGERGKGRTRVGEKVEGLWMGKGVGIKIIGRKKEEGLDV